MKELLRQIIEELENVHVVASSDRLFEPVEQAKRLLEEDDHEPIRAEEMTLGDAASDAVLDRLRRIIETLQSRAEALRGRFIR